MSDNIKVWGKKSADWKIRGGEGGEGGGLKCGWSVACHVWDILCGHECGVWGDMKIGEKRGKWRNGMAWHGVHSSLEHSSMSGDYYHSVLLLYLHTVRKWCRSE